MLDDCILPTETCSRSEYTDKIVYGSVQLTERSLSTFPVTLEEAE